MTLVNYCLYKYVVGLEAVSVLTEALNTKSLTSNMVSLLFHKNIERKKKDT